MTLTTRIANALYARVELYDETFTVQQNVYISSFMNDDDYNDSDTFLGNDDYDDD